MTHVDLKPLHHPQTFLAKYVFPLGAILLWWSGTYLLWDDVGGFREGSWTQYILPGGGVLFSAFMLYTMKTLKFVCRSPSGFVVRHFGREVVLPLSSVEDVERGLFRIQGQPVVVLKLRQPCEFGEEICFWPSKPMAPSETEHPLVIELKASLGRR